MGGRFGKNLEVEGECAWSCSAFSMLPRLLAATAGPLSRHQAAVHGHPVTKNFQRAAPTDDCPPPVHGKIPKVRYPATLLAM